MLMRLQGYSHIGTGEDIGFDQLKGIKPTEVSSLKTFIELVRSEATKKAEAKVRMCQALWPDALFRKRH